MIKLRPFFSFLGGKYRAAPHYPKPEYTTIIEPFAGSAGYSMRYPNLSVTLVERDPKIAATWRYILTSHPSDIRKLPVYDGSWSTVDDLDIPDGAKYLIGFWLGKARAASCKSPSAWMRSGINPNSQWGEAIRERIASQLDYVAHWRLIEGDYTLAENSEATWFIDPPYIHAGSAYRFGAKTINYSDLAAWCQERRGQVMVCENVGADWLPFNPFLVSKATHGKDRTGVSKEALWKAS